MKKRVIGHNGSLVSEIGLRFMGMSWLYGMVMLIETKALQQFTLHLKKAVHSLIQGISMAMDTMNFFYVKLYKDPPGQCVYFSEI
ncbi:hypothetical protein [Neobacillus massiliamazoniensis]|uniref:Uncharacterized protein n=1 Tax=Neobacillus massiliamazoniensis TaxID=1499688 RepID=A0A0U1NY56_9BACI|nr:hypothetical protein [Neobacillus massiliamazoniensis]CRK82916.1 hypothetical protein BN000_02871 [Neobacillus massiliamazoniensis]